MNVSVKIPAEPIATLKEKIESWRRAKSYRTSPMPDYLWDEAVALTKTYSRERVAKELSLSAAKLKGIVEKSSKNEDSLSSESSQPCRLVRIGSKDSGNSEGTRIGAVAPSVAILEGPGGTKLTIPCHFSESAMSTIIAAFMGGCK